MATFLAWSKQVLSQKLQLSIRYLQSVASYLNGHEKLTREDFTSSHRSLIFIMALLSGRTTNIFDFSTFKQAQTETLCAEEKPPRLVSGSYFAKAKRNSQLLFDSRKGTWNPFFPPAEGRGGPCQQLCQVPAAPSSSMGHIHTTPPPAEPFPPGDTAQPLICLINSLCWKQYPLTQLLGKQQLADVEIKKGFFNFLRFPEQSMECVSWFLFPPPSKQIPITSSFSCQLALHQTANLCV